MAKYPLMNFHRYSGSYLSVKLAVMLFLFALVYGTIGFVLIEGYTIREGFYMSVLAISTVGFEEVRPLSSNGEIFASIYILLNIGIFAYAITAFTASVAKGEIFRRMHMNWIQKRIEQLNDHVILCGFGKYGSEITHHFLKKNIPFVIIENDHHKIEGIQKSEEKLLYVEDDATKDETLIQAGIMRAGALIIALPDDTDNLFTCLSARQINHKINIISRAVNPSTEKKLKLAGADHVIVPEQIGGYHIANLVSKPGAVEFFSFITDEYESDIGFEVLKYEEIHDSCRDISIKDLDIREKTGSNIIAMQKKDGEYIINPSPDMALKPGTSFIVLGSIIQLNKLKSYMASFGE